MCGGGLRSLNGFRRFQLLDLGSQGVDVRKGLGFGFTPHGLLRFNRVCLSAFLADLGGVLGFPHGAEQGFSGLREGGTGLVSTAAACADNA